MIKITREEYERASNLIEAYRKQLCSELQEVTVKQQSIKQLYDLNTKLGDTDLSVRAYNVCRYGGECRTLGDVAALGREKLLQARNCGPVTLKEIENTMLRAGIIF